MEQTGTVMRPGSTASKPALAARIAGLFLITRPVNVLIAGLSITVAGYLCGIGQAGGALAAAAAAGMLITAAANAINDYFDIEIDRINKPQRPLPAGTLSRREAVALVILAFAAALACAALIGPQALLISTGSGLLLYWYSARLKRTVLWGNLTVSLVTGLAFLFGGIAVGRIEAALVPALFAFFVNLGREIIKDMEDTEGDRAMQARTLPVVYGPEPARRLASAVLLLLLALTWLPWLLGIYGRGYLAVVAIGVQPVLLVVVWALWRRPGRHTYSRLSTLLKADMLIGLLAIYAGR